MMQAPVTVLQANTKRDTGKKAQYGNIMAGKVRRALHRTGCFCRRQAPAGQTPPAANRSIGCRGIVAVAKLGTSIADCSRIPSM